MMKKASSSTTIVSNPSCSSTTKDLLRKKVLEKMSPNKGTSKTQLEEGTVSDVGLGKGLILESVRGEKPFHLEVQAPSGKHKLLMKQLSTPETPPLVISTSPYESQRSLGTPTPSPQPMTGSSAMFVRAPGLICVASAGSAGLGIVTPPPSATQSTDDYLVKPRTNPLSSSPGIYSSASTSSTSSLPSPITGSSSPLLRSKSISATETVLNHTHTPDKKLISSSHTTSMVMLPTLKDLIEKTYPKLPSTLMDGEEGQKYLIIECERLETLPNLLGPIRPCRLVLSSKGEFSFQCLFRQLYSGALSDNLLFSVALKSLTLQSDFRLCSAYRTQETHPLSPGICVTSKWGDSFNHAIDLPKCMMWFNSDEIEKLSDLKEWLPEEKWSVNMYRSLDRISICKNCRARMVLEEKERRLQLAQQVKQQKKIEKMSTSQGTAVGECVPKSSSSLLTANEQPTTFKSLMGVTPGRSRGSRHAPKSAPVQSDSLARDLAVKKHLAQKIQARLQNNSQVKEESTSNKVHSPILTSNLILIPSASSSFISNFTPYKLSTSSTLDRKLLQLQAGIKRSSQSPPQLEPKLHRHLVQNKEKVSLQTQNNSPK